MTRLRNFRARLFGPKCQHYWVNTGATYTDSQHGFTIVLRGCIHCPATLLVEV